VAAFDPSNFIEGTIMKRLASLFAAAAMAAATLAAPQVYAHATVQASEPAANAELAKSPAAIKLSFNEAIDPAFSTIVLQDSFGKPVPGVAKAVVGGDGKEQLSAELPALKTGGYIVRWVAIGPDGHRRTGQYNFSVK
jgi:methionine-rich copper-binding protein CopC